MSAYDAGREVIVPAAAALPWPADEPFPPVIDGQSATVTEQSGGRTAWSPNNDLPPGTLYWRVQAKDDSNTEASPFTGAVSFIVEPFDPTKAIFLNGPSDVGFWPQTTKITRVVLCSGKMSYELAEARTQQGAGNVALIRLEQLYPLEKDALLAALSRYREDVEVIWAQEEPRNMGAWTFVDAHLSPLLRGRRCEIECVARAPSASPAAGSATRHRLEQDSLLNQAIGGSPRIAVAGTTRGG